MNDEMRSDLLKRNHYVPPKNYQFPIMKQNNTAGDIRRTSHAHLDAFKWAVFSHEKKGLYCLPCALTYNGSFSKFSNAQFKTHKLADLVLTPLTSFIGIVGVNRDSGKPRGKLNRHEVAPVHKT